MELKINHIFLQVLPALQLKLDEFRIIYNYREITQEELWAYCVECKFENADIEQQRINKIVKIIFNISMLEIITYKQILDYYNQCRFSKLTEEEINFLLGSFRAAPKFKSRNN